jgi:hypothetical protein
VTGVIPLRLRSFIVLRRVRRHPRTCPWWHRRLWARVTWPWSPRAHRGWRRCHEKPQRRRSLHQRRRRRQCRRCRVLKMCCWVPPVLRRMVSVPSQAMTRGTCCGTWWCVDPTLLYPGALPRVMQPQPLGHQAPCARGYPDFSCWAPSASCTYLSNGGGWKTMWSSRDRRSPSWRVCCTRRWPRSTGTSCVWFKLVWKREESLSVRLVALPRARHWAGAARVRAQRGPDGRSGGCLLNLGARGLGLDGVTRPSFGCPQPS